MSGFGELEAVVMDRLWDHGEPMTVREVLEFLQKDREIAYTTVMTVMERLFRKDFLKREEQGRAFLYEPASSRADYTAQVMAQALADSADRTAALVNFAEHVSPQEAKALWEALDRRRGNRWRRPK